MRLLHAVELERLTLGRKLGFELSTAKDARIERGYLEQVDEDEPLNRSTRQDHRQYLLLSSDF